MLPSGREHAGGLPHHRADKRTYTHGNDDLDADIA